ncbi:UBX domain-containing protein 1-like isoform X5 [Durio zibethinus]|uniref:UBX domain-containing protein 1-like isoform X5 n=1 Tax=Durio zibethinus TaxID=66656 RepID=A0A6P6B2T8_DURZI|nr:UBX domain-containing protein 1-like isoform X5 [Durio zibethinus]
MHPQQAEIPVMEVKLKLLGELESLGFPRARAVRALHHSGNTTVEAAVNWLVDHENDAEIDQMPLLLTLRDRVRINKREEEKKREREREKERIRAGKELLEAKRIAEENERQRLLAFRKAEKEEEKRAREKVLQKLELDKSERKRALGLPLTSQAVKPSAPIIQEKKLQNSLPVKSVKKADRMRECLRSLKHTYRGDNARVKRAYQTLLIYVGNVARSPDEEKYRKIRLSNPKFQERVGNLKGGIEFLELCGFERSEGNDFLVFPREKVDIELLNSADSLLKSAITNPFFGLLEHVRED